MSTAVKAEPVFLFDEKPHRYTLDGLVLPSVTQVLSSVGIIDTQWFNEAGKWRGSAVHKWCELEDVGTIKEYAMDKRAEKYLDAWRKFKSETGIKEWVAIEVPAYSRFGFAGTADRIALNGNTGFVIDLKTGAIPNWARLQLAAYADMLEKPLRFRRIAVQLKPDGNYSSEEYSDVREYHDHLRVFYGALSVYQFKEGK